MVGQSVMSAHDAHPDTLTNFAAVSHSQCYAAYIQANQTIVKEIDKAAAKLKLKALRETRSIRHVRKLPATLKRSLTWDRGLKMAKHKDFTLPRMCRCTSVIR
jgi:hypothetical protein